MGKRGSGRWHLIRRYVLGAVLLCLCPVTAMAAECQPDKVDLRGDWGQAQFTVELADDAEERAQGLMHRTSMPRLSGMFFVYETPRVARFWMKNTPLSLDIIFLDQHGTVQKVHENAEPLSERLILGGAGIQYVLEVNAGVADQFGIGPGDVLRHPSISSESPAWPC